MNPRTAVVGSLLVIALGVGGGLTGFAIAEPSGGGSATVRASVEQPLASKLTAAQLPIAPQPVTREVPVGVSGDSIRDAALALLREATSRPDPQAAAARLLADYGFDGPRDPCAGNPTGDCPSPVTAVIAGPTALVIERAVDDAQGNLCAASPEDVVLAVTTNEATNSTVDYWDTEGELSSASDGEFTTDHCVILSQLPAGGLYSAHLTVTDQDGRSATRDLTLNSDGTPTRPPALFYAVTPDLIAVTVPHRDGENVSVYQNVPNGDSRGCDPVIAGYDRLVHPLGIVTAQLPAAALVAANFDEEYVDRTTYLFDVNEGITAYFCVQVSSPNSREPGYAAQAEVQTADRLVPTFTVRSSSGLLLPDWTVSGYLPSGQRCGSWRVPGVRQYSRVNTDYAPAHVLCDYTDVLGSSDYTPPGRGVLPLSAGDSGEFTVGLSYAELPTAFTALDLGAGASCTGSCVVPPASLYPVRGARGDVVIGVTWAQGNQNGSATTVVGGVTDTLSVRAPGARLDVATSGLRIDSFDSQARSGTATVSLRADRAASFTARLESGNDQPLCTRPNAVFEQSGDLVYGVPFTPVETATFTGLCAGADYRVIVQLTDARGGVSTWGEPGGVSFWGTSSSVHVPEMAVQLTVQYALASDQFFSGISPQAAFLSLDAGGLAIIGPRAGGCFGGQVVFQGRSFTGQVMLGENNRFSGVVQSAPADPLGQCAIQWKLSKLTLNFAFDLSLQELLDNPEGLVLRVDQPAGADPLLRGIASTIIRISAG